MMSDILFSVLLLIPLVYGAFTDYRHRIISNWVCIAIFFIGLLSMVILPLDSSLFIPLWLRMAGVSPAILMLFIARLIEKGILTSIKHGRANEYIPLITEVEYKQFETRSFLNAVHDGSVKNFITALYEGNDLTAEEIKELQEWFSQREVGK